MKFVLNGYLPVGIAPTFVTESQHDGKFQECSVMFDSTRGEFSYYNVLCNYYVQDPVVTIVYMSFGDNSTPEICLISTDV